MEKHSKISIGDMLIVNDFSPDRIYTLLTDQDSTYAFDVSPRITIGNKQTIFKTGGCGIITHVISSITKPKFEVFLSVRWIKNPKLISIEGYHRDSLIDNNTLNISFHCHNKTIFHFSFSSLSKYLTSGLIEIVECCRNK